MRKFGLLRALAAALCAVVVAGTFAFGGEFRADAAGVSVNMFPASPGEHTAVHVTASDEYGFRFNALTTFDSIATECPSWSDNIGVLTFKLYKWNGNYASTVAGVPVATKTAIDYADNASVALSFYEQQPGEYLYVIKHGTNVTGFWSYTSGLSNIYMYKNGTRQSGAPHARVNFTATAASYFGALSADTSASSALDYEVDPSTWVAVDGLGRTLPTNAEVGNIDDDKFVGVFYWTWHYNFAGSRPYNVTNIMKQYPEAKNDYNHPIWQTYSAGYYFWDEPVYGYYTSTDKYVIRKDAELLANAGVDVIFFDCTNGNFTWQPAYTALLEVYEEARNDGIKTPQIAFMLQFAAAEGGNTAIANIYADIYQQRKYEDLWFIWKGKPLIMAHSNSGMSAEIRNFFTFRKNDPLYFSSDTYTNGTTTTWGWLSVYPQAKYYGPNGNVEQMTVGAAQNANAGGLTAMNGTGIFGRNRTYKANYSYSYNYNGATVVANASIANAKRYGLNFQEQWDRALAVDPEFIFVTGWNEFVAGRTETWQGVSNAFPDQFNEEFSRDCAVVKGDLKDYYYYQLASNIRKFKGVSPIEVQPEAKTIDISESLSQWDSIKGSAHYTKNTPNRDTAGWVGTHYTNSSMRNDFVMTKVSYDRQNVYFYAETLDDITPYTDGASSQWMNLYIDTKTANGLNDHWENFEFVVNRTAPSSSKAYLEKSTGGWNWQTVAEVDYTVSGNVIQIKIPRSYLGLAASVIELNYKWADNSMTSGDILDFYTNGDVAPAGRYMVAMSSGSDPIYPGGLPSGSDAAGYNVDNSALTVTAGLMTSYSSTLAHYGGFGISVSVKDYLGAAKVTGDYLCTGDTLTGGGVEYKVVISGDLDRTGTLNTGDYILLKLRLKGKTELDAPQLAAADLDGSGVISTTDYTIIKLTLMGK